MICGLVTVVVPIYNVEKYLNRCIKSIITQSYKMLEIILIDDGSQDRCPEICDNWAIRDSRIRVIHKENQGLGMARNTGIHYATGEYICFIDSDDFIDEATIAQAYAAAVRNDAQTVIYGYKKIDRNGRIKSRCIPYAEQTFFYTSEDHQILLSAMVDSSSGSVVGNISMSAWSKLYSMKVIQKTGWRFYSEREYCAEDLLSNLEWFSFGGKTVILQRDFYNYCENPTSLTHTYKPDSMYQSEICYKKMLALCYKNGYSNTVVGKLPVWYFDSTVAICKIIMNMQIPNKKKLLKYKKILASEHFNQIMRTADFQKEFIRKRLVKYIMQKRWDGLLFIILYIQNVFCTK